MTTAPTLRNSAAPAGSAAPAPSSAPAASAAGRRATAAVQVREGLPFRTAAVIGLGTVGSAFARALAAAGVAVAAVEADDARLAAGRARTEHPAADGQRPGGTAGAPGTPDPAAIGYGTRLDALAEADLVLEALPERLPLKAAMLREAARHAGAGTVFATTTSLSVGAVAAAAGLLPRTVGLHPIGHTPAGGAVEVVPGAVTEAAIVTAAEDLVTALGATPVRSADRPGYLAGGLLLSYLNGAAAMLDRGYADARDIDAAMVLGCGLPRGPLAHLDLIGLDSALDTLRGLHELTGEARYVPAPVLAHLVSAGLLGVKSGRGFHRYGDGAGGPTAEADQPRPGGSAAAPRTVATVGVIGSGTMATGIAEVFAKAGCPTTLVARDEVRGKAALDRIAASLDRAVTRRKIGEADARAALDRLTAGGEMAAVAGCDLVVEAVAEDIDVKRAVFARLDAVCRAGAVLATTTSSLPVVECATATARPQDVVGLHFFNPAPVMRLVEVVTTALTAPDVTATALAVCGRLRKRPVGIADRPGFLVNALLFPYLNGAVRLLAERHTTAAELDTAMTAGCDYPMGPLALLDAIGLDVSLQIQHSLHHAHPDPSLLPAAPLHDLVSAGLLGRKTGCGFHRY
ncbi:3-hydroxyacyl-CoA dehydrogenase family protein [Streptomyces sp. NPDC020917]|uniref:3-hydroxyacyl-CoA dehydrogenase family protein n=1 Tax=Streptomyces sp. NPDC020917 TaxID=3365102 RepID=UPI0037992E8C